MLVVLITVFICFGVYSGVTDGPWAQKREKPKRNHLVVCAGITTRGNTHASHNKRNPGNSQQGTVLRIAQTQRSKAKLGRMAHCTVHKSRREFLLLTWNAQNRLYSIQLYFLFNARLFAVHWNAIINHETIASYRSWRWLGSYWQTRLGLLRAFQSRPIRKRLTIYMMSVSLKMTVCLVKMQYLK